MKIMIPLWKYKIRMKDLSIKEGYLETMEKASYICKNFELIQTEVLSLERIGFKTKIFYKNPQKLYQFQEAENE